MINRGMAWAFVKYSTDYMAAEADARQRQVGVWQVPDAMPAWKWRTNAWDDALREAPPGRPIKGNFKNKRRCIYHTPWSRHWRRVQMDPLKGDKWFANETEASMPAVASRASINELVRRPLHFTTQLKRTPALSAYFSFCQTKSLIETPTEAWASSHKLRAATSSVRSPG